MVVGREVEGYRISEVLGRGGMGVVYKAEDVALSRPVAVKRIAPSFANDKSFLRRFRSEAQALARIDSPHIVRVHALLETEIGLLLVMEYVDGGTLRDVMDRGPMDWEEARPLVEQTLRALEDAHRADVIHRDIKPSNVMLSAEGTVKVTDFGLAKVHRGDSRATVTQGVHGTLNYMSPEQVKGDADLDHRSDLYSLGMTVYEMLVGDLPFEKDSSEFSKMRMIVEEDVPQPEELRPQVPKEISELVMKALEKEPSDRFQSAQAMREAVYAVGTEDRSVTPETETEEHPTARPNTFERSRLRVAGIGFLVVLLTIGSYVMYDMMMVGAEGADGGGNRGHPPSGSGTQLSVHTTPAGANVYVDGQSIGATPLKDTIAGDSADVRVQKAGFMPLDTSFAVGNARNVALRLALTKEPSPTAVTIATDPSGATVYVDGDSIGESPLRSSIGGDAATVRVTKDGYAPLDTALQLNGTQRAQLGLTLTEADAKAPPEPHGTYRLRTTPTGSVLVNGEEHGKSTSLELPVGRHEVQFRHPEYGSIDTTIIVQTGETHELTAHFEHAVRVRSPETQGHVLLNGTSVDASTPHTLSIGPGAHRIGLRIQQDAKHSVRGGVYQKMVRNREVENREFSGNEKEVTTEPSFLPETHVVTFRVVTLAERVDARVEGLEDDVRRAIKERNWAVVPDPLAETLRNALDALYSKHEIETVRIQPKEAHRGDDGVILPLQVVIRYQQKGREKTRSISLPLVTVWTDAGGTEELKDARTVSEDRFKQYQ